MKKYILLFLIFSLFGCDSESSNIKQESTIYTSFYPMYFLTKEIVGTGSNVINIVPNSGEAHEYEPTAKQIKDMMNSKLIFLNGLGMESYESKLIENIKNVPISMISEQLDNLIKINEKENIEEKGSDGHEHGNIDPHTWLSPKTYSKMANILLLEIEKNGFKNIDKSIIEKINNLDKKFTKELNNCKRKKIITSHKAFAYLARDYGFTQFAVLGISPEEEPSAKDIANVVDLIKKEKINIIFGEELVSPKFTNTIKNETNAEVLNLNPLETLTPEQEKNGENYITIMEKNLEYLKRGLECN